MYGTQALTLGLSPTQSFENDVKMYGTQAEELGGKYERQFENDVKMYGTQATLEMEK